MYVVTDPSPVNFASRATILASALSQSSNTSATYPWAMAEPVIVSAADGPLASTVDQVKAIKAQGGTSVDFVLNRIDLVDDEELLELVELELRNIAEENGLTVASITRGSVPDGPAGIYGPRPDLLPGRWCDPQVWSLSRSRL